MPELEFLKMRLRELKARSGRGISCSLKKIKHAGKTDGIFCNIITIQEKRLKGDI
jgi:hypothetical protein